MIVKVAPEKEPLQHKFRTTFWYPQPKFRSRAYIQRECRLSLLWTCLIRPFGSQQEYKPRWMSLSYIKCRGWLIQKKSLPLLRSSYVKYKVKYIDQSQCILKSPTRRLIAKFPKISKTRDRWLEFPILSKVSTLSRRVTYHISKWYQWVFATHARGFETFVV